MTTEPLRRESSEDRRTAIAMAARALIVERGLEGLRTRDIAERVGINIATLHYHVPSKEALVELVAQSLRDEFRTQAQRNPRDGRNGLDQLRLEFADFRETVEDMPDLIIILTELVERARRDEAVAAIVLPLRAFWAQQFAEIFALGAADGSFRANIDPDAAALLATGSLSECWRQATRSAPHLDRLIAELERCFVNTVKQVD